MEPRLNSQAASLIWRHCVAIRPWPRKPQNSPTKHKTWMSGTISTPIDCHLLFDCGWLAIALYKMGNHSFTSAPSMSDLSMTSDDEETDSSSSIKHSKQSLVSLKTTWTTSQLVRLPLQETIPADTALSLEWSASMPLWSCGRSFFMLQYDPQPPHFLSTS